MSRVPVYGRAYPEASAYPAGIPVQALAPLQYAFTPGQRYPVGDLTVPTNYYRAVTYSLDTPNDHIDVVGQDRYYQISSATGSRSSARPTSTSSRWTERRTRTPGREPGHSTSRSSGRLRPDCPVAGSPLSAGRRP